MQELKYLKEPAPKDTSVAALDWLGYSCFVLRENRRGGKVFCYEVRKQGRFKMASRHPDLFASLAVAYTLDHIGASTQDGGLIVE